MNGIESFKSILVSKNTKREETKLEIIFTHDLKTPQKGNKQTRNVGIINEMSVI